MPASTLNLTGDLRLEAGSTWNTTFTFLTPAGDPWDLTSYTGGARMRLRRTADSAATILQLAPQTAPNLEGCYILSPATSGQVRVNIFASTLEELSYAAGAALTANRAGVYDLETSTTDTEPIVTRWIEGSYVIIPEVTRADS